MTIRLFIQWFIRWRKVRSEDEGEHIGRVTLMLCTGFSPEECWITPVYTYWMEKDPFKQLVQSQPRWDPIVPIFHRLWNLVSRPSSSRRCLTALHILAPKHDAERIDNFHRFHDKSILEDNYTARYSRKVDIRNGNLRVRSAAQQSFRKSWRRFDF